MNQKLVLIIISIFLICTPVYLMFYRNNNEVPSDLQQDSTTDEELVEDVGINDTAPYQPEISEYNFTYTGKIIAVTGSLTSSSFFNCTLKLCGFSNIEIEGCRFVNSNIHIVECENITFSENHVSQYYIHEDPAILVQNVNGLNFTSNTVFNNSIGMVISGGSGIDIGFNLFEACDQHNAIMGLDTDARIHNNVFRYNFPHALMIMNREEKPEVRLEIFYNLFDRNIEDAINFEDFRGAQQPTLVYNNIINGTGQAGINIEYNSWEANIIIKDNIIKENGLLNQQILDESGRPTQIYPNHPHQPEPYTEGWKHGVKLEDCSGVTLEGNIIENNRGSGIECTNVRDVHLKGNTITGNMDGITLRSYDESSLSREFSPLQPSNAGFSIVHEKDNKVSENLDEDIVIEESCQLIEIPDILFSASPIDLDNITGIVPLGAMNPPGHVFPTDHIYFYISRPQETDRPPIVPVYSPGDLIITSIRASEHVNAGITDYAINLETEEYPHITIVFLHISSLCEDLFGDISDPNGWKLESEYSTGGETYKSWSKNCMITVKAGEKIGTAGGNPGQWALDLGVYDTQYLPEQVANMDRWRYSQYLHSVCPLSYYEEGVVRDSLLSLVEGNVRNTTCNLVLQDILGTAQGCWFLQGTTNTYPEDPHLALVRSNIDLDIHVLSTGTSVQGLDSDEYEFAPLNTGLVNRKFEDVTPDGNIYGYNVEGYQGTIIIKMPDNTTLWIEALNYNVDPENWSFSENKTIFER